MLREECGLSITTKVLPQFIVGSFWYNIFVISSELPYVPKIQICSIYIKFSVLKSHIFFLHCMCFDSSFFDEIKKHFCCKEIFFSYRKENNYHPVKGGMKYYTKLKNFAEYIKNK